MIRQVFPALFIASLALTGCSGSTTQQTEGDNTTNESGTLTTETTVQIGGKSWTCETITASKPKQCGPLTQQAFDLYKQNILAYVNSGQLGPLNNTEKFSDQDVVFAGLVACAILLDDGDENEYIDSLRIEEPFKSKLTQRTDYLPAWFEAPKSLCTNLEAPAVNPNPGSNSIP